MTLAAAPAFAFGAHSLSGNARFNIGSLPVPIGLNPFQPPPNGSIIATPNATIKVEGFHQPDDPAPVRLNASQLTWNGVGVFPVAAFNPFVLQVGTALTLGVPKHVARFAAGGRTGAATVTWCPGQTVPDTPAGNPSCATNQAGVIPGRMTYTATGNQFGGPSRGAVAGTADVALGPSALAPCQYVNNTACTVRFVQANPAATGVNGGTFNVSNAVSSPSINPGNFGINVTGGGVITALVTVLGPGGSTNDGTSFGGPNTTGVLFIEQPAAAGGGETFTISGADNRTNPHGQGALSLVSGALSTRASSGPNAQRGWLNLVIGPQIAHVPAMPLFGALAFAALAAATGAHTLRRKNRR